MAQYAIAFDMDTKGMKAAHMTQSEIVNVYQREIPEALKACGFIVHPQGSLYHTDTEHNPITAIMKLQSTVRTNAPRFCQYVRRVHVFRMDEWSDVTSLIRTSNTNPTTVDPEEEVEQNDLASPNK